MLKEPSDKIIICMSQLTTSLNKFKGSWIRESLDMRMKSESLHEW